MAAIAPLLADVDGLIAIAIAVISIVGFISNLISGQQKGAKNAPGPRPKRVADRRVRDEIDAFLQQATGNKGPRAERPAPPPAQEPPRKAAQKTRPKPAPQRKAPTAESAERPASPESLGRGVQKHVQQHMAERVGQQVSRDLPTHTSQLAPLQLANTRESLLAPAPATPSRNNAPAGELLALLRSPQGRRQAIILGEILQKPLSLRR